MKNHPGRGQTLEEVLRSKEGAAVLRLREEGKGWRLEVRGKRERERERLRLRLRLRENRFTISGAARLGPGLTFLLFSGDVDHLQFRMGCKQIEIPVIMQQPGVMFDTYGCYHTVHRISDG
jgi:hypothetical protein